MPIYEYKCYWCGHEFEKLSFIDKYIECPNCRTLMRDIDKKVSTFTFKMD